MLARSSWHVSLVAQSNPLPSSLVGPIMRDQQVPHFNNTSPPDPASSSSVSCHHPYARVRKVSYVVPNLHQFRAFLFLVDFYLLIIFSMQACRNCHQNKINCEVQGSNPACIRCRPLNTLCAWSKSGRADSLKRYYYAHPHSHWQKEMSVVSCDTT